MITPEKFSFEAERAVIGALIIDNDAYDKISDTLDFHDFYFEKNRIIFKHI